MNFSNIYRDKTILVTGHTGFKGSWLCEWLLLLGAEVVGYSVDVPTAPSHFEVLGLSERLKADIRGDVRSLEALRETLRQHQPDFIFHLAAQPLVRQAFVEPYATVDINVMGSLNVLEAVRLENRSCVVIMVTTDKVYENLEWLYAYRENDALGGYDPYSASKACADILISSYQRSFFSASLAADAPATAPKIAVASVRGGNVLGGGDWAKDRIVPDCMRSLSQDQPIPIRNRRATRPWQHVLELLSGYMHLAAEISRAIDSNDSPKLQTLTSSFNFGPHITSNRTVGELVQEILSHWPGTSEDFTDSNASHEAGRLNLTIDKAYHVLGWQPQWNFEQTIEQTVSWYQQFYQLNTVNAERVQTLTQQQIRCYAGGAHYRVLD